MDKAKDQKPRRAAKFAELSVRKLGGNLKNLQGETPLPCQDRDPKFAAGMER